MSASPLRIVIMPPFDKEFFGVERLSIDAGNLFELIEKLDAQGPGFAKIARVRAHLAVDGVLETDWTRLLADVREVIVLPRVGGG
ncbi:MoaD/ThiS family protein [Novosphingobium sp. PY1]|uniref:MoaD/ThiS family protein n=1 Tax=Novosphingobium sp. PY1 TaxID=1882221 RepID=UPI001A904BF5|nr:hypothetical protein [Novosphingobium sp. PY1]GFM29658.1 putative uncharacterized protein [Novosphingobium sp. PY1]